MISILKGVVAEKFPNAVVIDCRGIGYFVHVPANVSASMPENGAEGTLYTLINKSKTDISMIGFSDDLERSCFRFLTSISGCGTKSALALLSTLTPAQIYRAIADNDASELAKVKGVGKKLTQRIVVELKDRISAPLLESGDVEQKVNSNAIEMETEALISLGYKRKEAVDVISKI